MQLAVVVDATWARLQGLGTKLPAPVLAKVTDPVGVLLVPASVSATVAVQVVELLTPTLEGEQVTVVEVLRLVTVSAKLPAPELALPVCVESPL